MIAPSSAANGDVRRAARREAHAFGDRAAARELEQCGSLGFARQYELETAVTRVLLLGRGSSWGPMYGMLTTSTSKYSPAIVSPSTSISSDRVSLVRSWLETSDDPARGYLRARPEQAMFSFRPSRPGKCPSRPSENAQARALQRRSKVETTGRAACPFGNERVHAAF